MRQFDVQFFAVSVDSVDANRRFAASLGIDYPILSDPTKATARAYGVLAPSGFASRATVYVGRDGRILAIDRKVNAATHGQEIVARLRELGM